MRRGAVVGFVLVAGCSSALVVELAPDGSADGRAPMGDGGVVGRDAPVEAFVITPYCTPQPPALAPSCPPSEPLPGAPCASLDLTCVYPIDAAGAADIAWGTCADSHGNPAWSFIHKTCAHDCASVRGAGVAVAVDAGDCASSVSSACAPSPSQTAQDVVDAELSAVVKGCGIPPEQTCWVFFERGCATEVLAPSAAASACIANALMTRPVPCATEVACGAGTASVVR